MPSSSRDFGSGGRTSGTLPLPEEAVLEAVGIAPPIWGVVFAGGIGSRFWPLSTPATPKPVLPLVDDRPLIADTVGRLDPLVPAGRVLVVTRADIADVVRAGAESGRVIRRDEPPHTFIAQYEFASRAALDAYLAHHAPRLRAEGVRRFGDRVSYRRRVGQTVNRVT